MENQTAIICNGTPQSLENGSTISKFLDLKKIDPACIVVELNKDIVRKDAFGATVLKNNDSVEILHFVGGG